MAVALPADVTVCVRSRVPAVDANVTGVPSGAGKPFESLTLAVISMVPVLPASVTLLDFTLVRSMLPPDEDPPPLLPPSSSTAAPMASTVSSVLDFDDLRLTVGAFSAVPSSGALSPGRIV